MYYEYATVKGSNPILAKKNNIFKYYNIFIFYYNYFFFKLYAITLYRVFSIII